MTIKIGGYEIEQERDLAGVVWWVQVYNQRRPQFEVFRYVGQDRAREILFFESRQDKAILMKRWAELATLTDFKPFLMDTAAIKARLQEYKGES
jgi:hypothetical protein